jgi:hypothetical protein
LLRFFSVGAFALDRCPLSASVERQQTVLSASPRADERSDYQEIKAAYTYLILTILTMRVIMRLLVLLPLFRALPVIRAQQQPAAALTDDGVNSTFQAYPFGMLDLQIRSHSSSTLNNFLFNVLAETSAFLDEHLQKAFHKGVLFSHVTLNVDSYDLVDTPTIRVNTSALTEDKVLSYASNYDASVSLQGMALFDRQYSQPWKLEVTRVVRNTLMAHSKDLQQKLASTQNELLRNLQFVIVTLNGETIAGNNYTNAFAGAKPKSTASSISNASPSKNTMILPTWAMAVMTSLACVLLLLALIYVGRNIRAIHRTNNRKGGAPTQKLTTDTDDNDYNDDDDDDTRMGPEVSPMNSDIISVASSAFTYNPAHLYSSKTPPSATRTKFSPVAAVNKSSMNHSLLLFQNNDISAISNKKDLSLIDEEQSQDAASAFSVAAAAMEPASPPQHRGQDYYMDSSALDLSRPTQTVIDDLKDLSAQIDIYRKSGKGGDVEQFL